MIPPSIRLHDCWAKTDPTTERPALTVRDHCMIVGAVAEAVQRLLPKACRNLPPVGAVTFTAAHDIGKITPGFLRKCPRSLFWKISGIQQCAKNHALVSQAFLASLPEMQDEKCRPLAWSLSAGGHHGSRRGWQRLHRQSGCVLERKPREHQMSTGATGGDADA